MENGPASEAWGVSTYRAMTSSLIIKVILHHYQLSKEWSRIWTLVSHKFVHLVNTGYKGTGDVH